VKARSLLLLEAPGPKTAPEWGGSGFVSVDNNDVTAESVWLAREAAGLEEHVIAWNIVPWVLGRANKKPSPAYLAQGPSSYAASRGRSRLARVQRGDLAGPADGTGGRCERKVQTGSARGSLPLAPAALSSRGLFRRSKAAMVMRTESVVRLGKHRNDWSEAVWLV
jgi:hypothetical protein